CSAWDSSLSTHLC
nr:immunoglobulin light chain junction region [Macaca mulatta]MPO04889.1 immunoglobulin light chain junction region [Macaca mulatta]MPO09319.1 immunoglobulin light chain junction region [Macaca mulatta]MPO13542.1 immunoglobulin light chain junction region [Macaca mulatta]